MIHPLRNKLIVAQGFIPIAMISQGFITILTCDFFDLVGPRDILLAFIAGIIIGIRHRISHVNSSRIIGLHLRQVRRATPPPVKRVVKTSCQDDLLTGAVLILDRMALLRQENQNHDPANERNQRDQNPSSAAVSVVQSSDRRRQSRYRNRDGVKA